jgi:hypothetical protein
VLSWIFLLGTKADWRGDMNLARRGFRRLARILEMILYTILHKLMGLKWLAAWEPLDLGIRARKVWFWFLSRQLLLKKFQMQFRTSFLTRHQYFL